MNPASAEAGPGRIPGRRLAMRRRRARSGSRIGAPSVIDRAPHSRTTSPELRNGARQSPRTSRSLRNGGPQSRLASPSAPGPRVPIAAHLPAAPERCAALATPVPGAPERWFPSWRPVDELGGNPSRSDVPRLAAPPRRCDDGRVSEMRVVGRYQLVRLIGTGGSGEVWEAVLVGPHGFRRSVALKLLKAGRMDARHRESLIQEARLGAALHHPNVVATYELGESDGRLYIAMELVRGYTAAELLNKRGPLAVPSIVAIGVQACAGLHHIHHHGGLVHRNVKTSNLLVDRASVVKVADLGISTTARSGEYSGTPGYMAPEQISGGPVDRRADLFGLGVTLCTLAMGSARSAPGSRRCRPRWRPRRRWPQRGPWRRWTRSCPASAT